MQYLVFRKDTLSGADYQVTAHADYHRAKAICVGEIEASSRANAAFHLKQLLRTGLNRGECFFPGPHF